MNPDSRIAIAGGGIIGLSIAWRLAQRGRKVTVCEKARIGGEASWAAAGMLAPGGEFDRPSRLASLAIESRAQYAAFVRELMADSGVSIEYRECGALELAYSREEFDALQEKGRRQASMGIANEPIAIADLRAFAPGVRTTGLAGARFYPGDAIVNPRELTTALRSACLGRGVEIREGCEVSALHLGDQVLANAGGAVEHYGAVVIAAGAWSASIKITGAPPLPAVEAVKGHLIAYRQFPETCPTIVRHRHNYLLKRGNGTLIVGSSEERVGFDRTIDAGIVSSLSQRAGFLLPDLVETHPSEAWVGFRPAGAELNLGPWHSERLLLAYGHNRNGILLAPVTAALFAKRTQSPSSFGNPTP